jgi:hypothetical protein
MKKLVCLSLFTALATGCIPRQRGQTPGQVTSPPPLVMAGDPNRNPNDPEWGIVDDAGYPETVRKVVGMVSDAQVRAGVERRGLDLVNLMWEDTGRHYGSSVGPNITDLTLQVAYRDPGSGSEQTALMPVIRFPNFTDRTGDVRAGKFLVRMGNHRDPSRLETVPLTDVLRDIRRFASQPGSIRGPGNLLAGRDTHFLVSAQAVFLPIPSRGRTEFNPAVYNYQSQPGAPAVLVLLVTRQGTSMTVVENRAEERTRAGWGQELYFNNAGQRAAFTAERQSDVVARIQSQGGPKTEDDRSALARGADTLFLVQVPLRHPEYRPPPLPAPMSQSAPAAAGAPAPMKKAEVADQAARSDVEQAVLGHGRDRGPYDEGHSLWIERDDRFPIRITVQFYKATSNGVVDERDLDAIARSLGSVYEHADFVGSLVIPEGDPRRPTDWQRMPANWFPW